MGRRDERTKLIILTGASAGIGLAATYKFISKGFRVINLSRRPCPNPEVTSIGCDLAEPNFIDDLAPKLLPLIQGAKTIHLIHNAARYLNDTATTCSNDILAGVMQTNVIALNSLNSLLIPHMQEGSSIVFVGSTLSEKAVAGVFSYVVSKHAQVGMMRALCQDMVGTGVHTAMVCPGFTDTEMLHKHVPEEALESIASMSAFGRLIDPDEIADAIVWVTENPVLNGSVIHANLGQIEQ